MKRKRYPKYKPSGVPWLGDVPEHWDVTRLKNAFALQSRKNGDESFTVALENIESWTGKYIETNSEFDGDGVSFQKGDILFGKLRPYLAKVFFAETEGEAIGDLFVLRPQIRIHPAYAARLLRDRGFIEVVDGSTYGSKMPRASWETVANMSILVPPASEQAAIAAFLDREVAKIDASIAKNEKLIELLWEKRAALISQAVTKGLNPSMKLKPSGVEWLGDVPEHWEIEKLSRLFSYRKGREASILTKEYIADHEGSYPVLSGQTENDSLMGSIDWFEFDLNGDSIFVTTVGAKAMTTRLVSGQFSLSQNCALMIPRDVSTCAEYFEAVLQPLFVYEKASISLIMQPSLRFEDLSRFRVPNPPAQEQVEIAKFLKKEVYKIEQLIFRTIEARKLLSEYRTSLIGAAVTGKIDVRNVA